MNALPIGDYLKHIPKFNGEGEVTTEDHLANLAYAGNLNIEHEDVWMRVFVQSLEGDVRKWFRSLTTGSITGVEVLDDTFLRKWGDKKDFLYYITEFGAIKRNGESVSDFSKRFSKMYSNIPTEIKPTEASAKISYVGPFDLNFHLLLRERRSATLSQM